jgi:hypothetical protein
LAMMHVAPSGVVETVPLPLLGMGALVGAFFSAVALLNSAIARV